MKNPQLAAEGRLHSRAAAPLSFTFLDLCLHHDEFLIFASKPVPIKYCLYEEELSYLFEVFNQVICTLYATMQ